jgi:hypothetical protein
MMETEAVSETLYINCILIRQRTEKITSHKFAMGASNHTQNIFPRLLYGDKSCVQSEVFEMLGNALFPSEMIQSIVPSYKNVSIAKSRHFDTKEV